MRKNRIKLVAFMVVIFILFSTISEQKVLAANSNANVTVPNGGKLTYESHTYDDNGRKEQFSSLSWSKIKNISGYIIYICDTKNGKYIEKVRVDKNVTSQYGYFKPGSYVKMGTFLVKNGKVYYGALGPATKISYTPLKQKIPSIPVTKTEYKAPGNVKLGYGVIPGREASGKVLYISWKNSSSVEISNWMIRGYDKYNAMIFDISYGDVIESGATGMTEISDSISLNLDCSSEIKTITVTPVDAGNDGCTGMYDGSDDTYGKTTSIKCDIATQRVYKGEKTAKIKKDGDFAYKLTTNLTSNSKEAFCLETIYPDQGSCRSTIYMSKKGKVTGNVYDDLFWNYSTKTLATCHLSRISKVTEKNGKYTITVDIYNVTVSK